MVCGMGRTASIKKHLNTSSVCGRQQDELDVSERSCKSLEERLDEKTAQLITLQRVTIEQNAVSPVKSVEIAQAIL